MKFGKNGKNLEMNKKMLVTEPMLHAVNLTPKQKNI